VRRRKESKGKTEKEAVGWIERDVKRAGVSIEDTGDRVKWKLRTRVADPKQLGDRARGQEKNVLIHTITFGAVSLHCTMGDRKCVKTRLFKTTRVDSFQIKTRSLLGRHTFSEGHWMGNFKKVYGHVFSLYVKIK